MSTYLADELRRSIDLAPTQRIIRVLELAVMVERMETMMDEIVGNACAEQQTLEALIARCNGL